MFSTVSLKSNFNHQDTGSFMYAIQTWKIVSSWNIYTKCILCARIQFILRDFSKPIESVIGEKLLFKKPIALRFAKWCDSLSNETKYCGNFIDWLNKLSSQTNYILYYQLYGIRTWSFTRFWDIWIPLFPLKKKNPEKWVRSVFFYSIFCFLSDILSMLSSTIYLPPIHVCLDSLWRKFPQLE
jgi:hypothetical protein